MSRPFRIGLALGGGAARAFSHIGVIAGLQKHGIPIDIVTGTSMGAIIGAMYAARGDVAAVKSTITAYLESEEFATSGFEFFRELDADGEGLLFQLGRVARRGVFNTLMVTRTALVSNETAMRNYACMVDDMAVEDTRIPFAAVALDLKNGEVVLLDRGPLLQAIAASCAMPGVLNPVEHQGRLLVDGGWGEPVPCQAARQLGADMVIAVDVGDHTPTFDEPRNALDVIGRADALVRTSLAREQLKSADIILSPQNNVAHWADFSTAEEAIARGEEEVDRRISELRRAIGKVRGRSWWSWGAGKR
ncbi:putative acylesterase/phospholipase RssA [Desulfuromonas soudanensis]|uniref:Putative acylesterase/phospholipase RssA n=1 Tax=Desulfuromonas soudanensis TaxID=1603606 RepID=A0A0M4D0K2_9BACT|nr:patatin-like phospholipase family protein [Desulfuromonas soudanensis]ALC16096.1 putative acylesterase/phospholipase RssA [Desulfuromonas soudanensis]